MAAFSTALMAGLAVNSLASSYSSYQSQKAQGEYQNSVAGINARFSEMQARDAIKRGDEAAIDLKKKTKGLIGSQRASLAAQGIEVDSGSAADIQFETQQLGEVDAMKIRNNAWKEAWGFKAEARNSLTQGKFAKMGANQSAKNTLLTGGIQAISQGADGYFKSNSYLKGSPKSVGGGQTVGNSAGSGYKIPGREYA